jgi:Mn2+/Fe2+ NRAMP family transporter
MQAMQRGCDQPRDEMRSKETTAGAGPVMVRVIRRPLALLPALGPGLIAGASDNDPTTVATLAVIGSTTGYGLAWLVVLVIPMLVIVQVVSASVGVVARAGLEDVIRVRYGRLWGLVALLLVLAVNLVTLAADLEGGSAALSLLTGRPYQWFMLPFALAMGAFLIWGSYRALERVLRYVLLVFLGYIVTAFLAHPNWDRVLHDTLVPHVSFSPAYVAGALALLGTTLTSYAYVWETIEEAQEKPSLDHLGLVQVDAGLGMVMAGVIFWFIIIGTGATLGVHHKPVRTAQDAAAALAPLASAVLAVPVLAGTSAYVMAEAFGWRASLDERFARAPAFYASLLLSLAVGVSIAYVGVRPIRLLFLSGIAGGLATPVTLAFMMRAARDRRVMGDHRIGGRLAAAGWLVAAVVTTASVLYLWQTFARPGH